MGANPMPTKALSCRCKVTLADAVPAALRTANITVAGLPYAPTGTHTFEVLVHEDAARVTCLSEDGKPSWAIVRRADTRAASMWDYQQQTVHEFGHDEVGRTRIPKPLHVSLKTTTRGERVIATLSVEDARAGSFTQELVFATTGVAASLGAPLFRLLYGGPACHADSGIPVAELEKLGCLVEASTYAGPDRVPMSRLAVEQVEVVDVTARHFAPPPEFSPTKRNRVTPGGPDIDRRPSPSPARPTPPPGASPLAGMHTDALRAERQPTPTCLESTRTGSMAAVLHQDALDHVRSLINSAASMLGTATLNSGVLTLNWLAALTGLGPGATGSGLASFLRVPRTTSTSPAGLGGGGGVLDCLALRDLVAPDQSGLSRLQQEASSGALNNTMRGWGLATSVISDLFAVGGNLASLPMDERIGIVEAYETTDFGILRVPGLPFETKEFFAETTIAGVTLQFAKAKLWSLTGTTNFATLAGAPLISSTAIGDSGNIELTLAVPTTTVTATVTFELLPVGAFAVNVGSAVACFLFPLSCPLIGVLNAALSTFLLQELSVITATTAGVGLAFDISYQWDPAANLLNPVVTCTGTTGSVSVNPGFSAPNFIAFWVEAFLAAIGNELDLWVALVGDAIASAVQDWLRTQGLSFPMGTADLGITALSGSTRSNAGSTLTLMTDVGPTEVTSSLPYVTQVIPVDELADELETCQAALRSDILTATKPGSAVDSYAALALSQNALNYYAYWRWMKGDFNVDITDSQLIAKLVALLPAGTFARTVTRIHAWPAVSPRVEIAEQALVARHPPLIVAMDDVRVCFEAMGRVIADVPQPLTLGEFSANLRAAATLTLEWPAVPRLLFDQAAIGAGDVSVWEWVDPNQTPGTSTSTANWGQFLREIAGMMLNPTDFSKAVPPPPAPLAWRNPVPIGQPQELIPSIQAPSLVPQSLYMDLLAQRRGLYLMPVLRTILIEFFNGSPAPDLNGFFGTMGVTLMSMSGPQGTLLRQRIVPAAAELAPFVLPGPV